MTRYLSWNGRRSSIILGMIMLVVSGILPLYSPSTAYACYTWTVGSRVGLRAGAEIREGSGFGYRVHTIVPEDNWQVDLVGGPRSVDGEEWWDISRRNVDGGGTGWVYIRQAGYDVCSGSPQPPQPQPQPQPPSPAPPAPAPAPDQVQVCEHANYGEPCETFSGSDPDLRNNIIGNDRASSIRIPSSYRVALYEHVDYQGRCQEVTGNISSFEGTYIGNDNISSLQINVGCTTQSPSPPPSQPTPAPAPVPGVVQVCVQPQFMDCESFYSSEDIDLRDNAIGNDRASSIKIPSSQLASLYEHINYQGRCQDFTAEVSNLAGSFIGDDTASSVLVGASCPPSPQGRWCFSRARVYDMGGGGVLNQEYVLELDYPRVLGNDVVIYFDGGVIHLDYHGFFDGRFNRWGVSTVWAYATPGWDHDNRWLVQYSCG